MRTHKSLFILGGVSLLLVITVGIYMLFHISEDSESSLSEEAQTEAVTEFQTHMLDDPIPYTEATTEFETLMPKVNKENQVQLLDTYMMELDSQLNQLNGMVAVLQEDLASYNEDIDTLLSDAFIQDLPDTMVKGFLSEMQDSYFILLQDDEGMYRVKTDYPMFKDKYEESLSDDMSDYLTLAEHANEHEYYDSAAGYALFPALKDRLDLIRSLMDGDEVLETSRLVTEEYMTYQSLLGIADMGMNTEDGEYNQDAIDQMKKVMDASDDDVLNQDMQTVIDSMKEEGSYGEKTEAKALSIIEDRFSELLSNMEQELGNEPDTNSEE